MTYKIGFILCNFPKFPLKNLFEIIDSFYFKVLNKKIKGELNYNMYLRNCLL